VRNSLPIGVPTGPLGPLTLVLVPELVLVPVLLPLPLPLPLPLLLPPLDPATQVTGSGAESTLTPWFTKVATTWSVPAPPVSA
jgi:hypothetical protein